MYWIAMLGTIIYIFFSKELNVDRLESKSNFICVKSYSDQWENTPNLFIYVKYRSISYLNSVSLGSIWVSESGTFWVVESGAKVSFQIWSFSYYKLPGTQFGKFLTCYIAQISRCYIGTSRERLWRHWYSHFLDIISISRFFLQVSFL